MADCSWSLRVAHRSKCPSPRWRAAIAAHLVAAAGNGPVTLVNVGSNKGWVVQAFLELYRGSPSAAAWERQLHKTVRGGHACGLCFECEANATATPGAPPLAPRVQVHAFDLLSANAELLRGALTRFGGAFGYYGQSSVTHGAVGNYTGLAYTRSATGKAGDEAQSAKTGRQGPHRASVPALTLDAWREEHAVGRISELTIDAEGWDALVLEGARKLLRARAVDVVEFEYNEKGKWVIGLRDRRFLKATLAELLGYGYSCFWQGGTDGRRGQGRWLGLAPANGEGWCERAGTDRPFWSNLVCSWRPEVLATFRGMVAPGAAWPT